MMTKWKYSAVLLIACLPSWSFASSVTTFDDIEYWVGSGANRAALAIDWDGDNSNPAATSLVWGYRWDGVASGEDMLRAVLADDVRLFAKLNAGGTFGVAVYSLGYDEHNAPSFSLQDGTAFNADGVAVTSPSDGILANDPGDRYAEGWLFGYWHYATTAGPNPTGWTSSAIGATSRMLADGSWDSFAFSPSFSTTAFADALLAAAAPPLPGDYNGNGKVDAADYTVWRDTMGDLAAYNLWRDNYGASHQNSLAVPEPTVVGLLLSCLLLSGWPPLRLRRPQETYVRS